MLGGTIGNFPPGSRRRLLREIAALLGPDDRLLLGTDLVKDPRVLEAAYDDAAGVTAEFNRNVLHVINRELDADFDRSTRSSTSRSSTAARVDRDAPARAARVHGARSTALGLDVEFADGEEIRTEISAKFTPRAGRARTSPPPACALDGWHTDAQERFALSLAAPAAG